MVTYDIWHERPVITGLARIYDGPRCQVVVEHLEGRSGGIEIVTVWAWPTWDRFQPLLVAALHQSLHNRGYERLPDQRFCTRWRWIGDGDCPCFDPTRLPLMKLG